MSANERVAILRKVGDLILERKEELSVLELLDTGKPAWLSGSIDIPRAAYNFHFFSDYMKRLSYELGGKNPNVIFADSNLDEVIETTMKFSFVNQGEVCLCGSRIYVERPAYEAFLDKFAAKTKELVIGDPFDAKTKVGALISEEHYVRVNSYIKLAVEEGFIQN